MLSKIRDTFDKRPGSIIHDALSPAAVEFVNQDIQLEIWKEQTYLLTATGNNLDLRGGDFSVTRYPATYAYRIAHMWDQTIPDPQPVNVAIASRYAMPNPALTGNINFIATENTGTVGEFILQCETPGTIGNEYFGDILPLFIDNRLGRAEIVGTQIPGNDEESDDDYRARIIAKISQAAFGGNIADYKRFTKEIEGVGDLKVFPVWNGGGTVLLSVVDGSYDPITPQFIEVIKNAIDPEEDTGLGVGVAPIGHTVTVITPSVFIVNIQASVTLDNVTIGQIQQQAEENIAMYFKSIRQSWGDSNVTNIFNIQIANAILAVNGVINVTNVLLNGIQQDITLTETTQLQQLPYMGTVTLNNA